MKEVGIEPPLVGARARAWLDWGQVILSPALGCVVVYERKGGGHVGFVVGRDEHGNLMTLGGNQGDRVSIRPFEMSRVLGYRWPPQYPVIPAGLLPVVASDGIVSKQEI
jgi:uncharacterized protein (TIGR02594 family)